MKAEEEEEEEFAIEHTRGACEITRRGIQVFDKIVGTQVGKAGKTGGSAEAPGDAPAKKKRRVSWGADQEREFVS